MASRSSCKPHALAVPLPYQGHIHPLLELSKKLVSAGFMVTFANTQAIHEQIKGFSKQRSSKEQNEREAGAEEEEEEEEEDDDEEEEEEEGDLHFVSLEEGFPAEFEDPLALLAEVLKPEMKAAVERLLARLCEKGPPVSLIAFDYRLIFVQDIAAKAGISSLFFWPQSAANLACNLLLARGYQLPPDDSTLITCVGGVPPFKRCEISLVDLQSSMPWMCINGSSLGPYKCIYEATWVVINTFEELESATLDTLQANLGFRPLVFGPLVNAPSFNIVKGIKETGILHSHLEWLQEHPHGSVLYVAFGTVVTLSEEQLEELVLGLEASEQPLFWVFRPTLCGNSKKYTLDALSRRFKSQGLVVDWASQWQVLSHFAVGGFLTHCGWNSTLEGITAGVPMLGWPIFADQHLNRRCLEDQWAIGMGLTTDKGNGKLVSRIEIQRKVKELMQGEKGKQMRENVRSLSQAAKRAFQKGGPCHRDLMLLTQSNGRTDSHG